MPTLILTSMFQETGAFALSDFQKECRLSVQHKYFRYTSALPELINFALRSEGPDVSQVGTTWLGSLTGLATLRMFRRAEVEMYGGQGAFIPSSWQGSSLPDSEDVYAIPWLSDVRFLAYRRDILEKARIDETKAFVSAEAFAETLACLQAAGVENILALSTVNNLIYHLASWVWGAGGNFRTPDHRHLTLTAPPTLAGAQQFFQLYRYLAPASRNLLARQCTELFCQGGAAVALTRYPQFKDYVSCLPGDISLEAIGFAPVPGVPFIGGSSLVVWLHSYQEEAAVKLVQHLVSAGVQRNIFLATGELPVRADIWTAGFFSSDRLLQVCAQSLKTGRPFQSSRKWAVIEIHLNPALSGFFTDLQANPDLDLETEVPRRFSGLQKSIEQSLLGTYPLI